MENISFQQLKKYMIEREKSWPARCEYYLKAKECLDELILKIIQKSKDVEYVPYELEYEKILCVVGPMKSGTSVIESVFDNHQSIFSTPPDAFLYGMHIKNFKKDNTEYLESIMKFWLSKLIMSSGQSPFFLIGENENNYVNLCAGIRYLYRKDDSNDMFHSVSRVIHSILHSKNGNYKYLVEKTPETEFNAKKLSEIYSNIIFLHVVRNPLNIINSLKKLDSKRGYHFDLKHKIKHASW